MEIKKDELGKFILQDEDKCMSLSNSFLGNLYVDFYYADKKDLWFNEHFDIRKDDLLYNLVDSIFFSYGENVFFDTDSASAALSLEKKKNGDYSFTFENNFNEESNVIHSVVDSCSLENESLKSFYCGLKEYSLRNVPMKKALVPKKNKK